MTKLTQDEASEDHGQRCRMPSSNEASTEPKHGYYWLPRAGRRRPSAPQSQYCETDGRLTEMLATFVVQEGLESNLNITFQ